jgi:hypothetical protein
VQSPVGIVDVAVIIIIFEIPLPFIGNAAHVNHAERTGFSDLDRLLIF